MSSRPGTGTVTRAEEAGLWCLRLSDGPLASGDQAKFDSWLAADPRNGQALEEAARTWRELAGAEQAPEFLAIRVEALQAARRGGRSPPWWNRQITRRAAIAAGLLLAVGLGGLGVWRMHAPTVYETGVGEREVVRLDDGSRLSLDAASRVEVRYARSGRALRLAHGRAKFEVAKDALRPFSVAAADKVIVATGTAFSVELVQRQVRVVLYEGRVSVLGRQAGNASAKPLRAVSQAAHADQALTPGRELVAEVSSTVALVEPTEPGRTLAWEAGQLVFVDEPLAAAVERVNRYSDEKLQVGDPVAARVLVTGVFTAGDTQAFVEGVTAAFPLNARRAGAGRVLQSRGG